MKLLYCIRGLPGSGKSTIAKKLAYHHFEADQYFERNGEYLFVPSEIRNAHQWCNQHVRNAMLHKLSPIAVSNTFTQKWEVEPYIKLAKEYDYEVQIITVQSNFKNVHDVPEESLNRMKNRWENFTLEDFE